MVNPDGSGRVFLGPPGPFPSAPDIYQIGPMLSLGPSFQQVALLVPNDQGAAFHTAPFYDSAEIPEKVPGDGNKGGILIPSGFRKGDAFNLPKTNDILKNVDGNPFIIGVGRKIAFAAWCEINDPFLWKQGYFYFRDVGYHFQRHDFNRVFVWFVELEFTITIPVIKPPVFNPPPPAPIVAARRSGRGGAKNVEIIPYSKGFRRLEGYLIWALGLEAGDLDIGEAAYGNMAYAYGYPLHPGEEIFLAQLIANGKEIWNSDAGVIDAELGTWTMEVYTGTEEQTVDPEILADKSAARAPAFRGLIYIRFSDFSLAQFGNRYPQIDAVFEPVDQERITVSDALIDVGVLGGQTILCENIDDEADGVVFYGMDPRDIIERYAQQYNYHIVDGDPIRLVRKEVEDGAIATEFDLEQTDFADPDADSDVVVLERIDDSDVPGEFLLTYTDMTQAYQKRPQRAVLPKFPISIGSNAVEEVDTDFIISAPEAINIAFKMLYLSYARRTTSPFTLIPDFATLEESDVLLVPTGQGAIVMDVISRTVNPDKTVEVISRRLFDLAAELDADAGDLTNTRRKGLNYPQIAFGPKIIVHERLYTGFGLVFGAHQSEVSSYGAYGGICGAPKTIPSKLPARYAFFDKDGLGYLDFGGYRDAWTITADYVLTARASLSHIPYDAYDIDTYGPWVHLVDRATMRLIQKFRFDPPNRDDLSALEHPEAVGFGQIVATNTVAIVSGYHRTGVTGGILGGEAIGHASLFRLDFLTSDVFTEVEVPGVGPAPVGLERLHEGIIGLVRCGTRVAVFTYWSKEIGGVTTEDTGQTLYVYDIASGALEGPVDLAHRPGGCVASGEYVYCLPYDMSIDSVGIRIHMPSLAVDYWDAYDDPTVVVSPTIPWTDGTYLYFVANAMGKFQPGVDYFPYFINAPYVAMRTLADMSVPTRGGLDLTLFLDSIKWQPVAGDCDDDFHYILCRNMGGTARRSAQVGSGGMLKLELNAVYGQFFPPTQPTPVNDDFPGIALKLNVAQKFNNEFGTKEPGEPDHLGNPGGNSLWWTFVPLVTATYRLTITPDPTLEPIGTGINAGGFPYIDVAIYTGESLESLSRVAGGPVPSATDVSLVWPTEIDFFAVAGQRYRVVAEGWLGYVDYFDTPPEADAVPFYAPLVIKVALPDGADEPPLNDPFAGAFEIDIGDTTAGHNNILATKEAGEPDHGGDPGGKSLWWKITIDNPDIETIRVTASATDSAPLAVGVYTGAAVGALVEVGSAASEEAGTPEDWTAWSAATL